MTQKNRTQQQLGDNYIPLRIAYRIQTFMRRLRNDFKVQKVFFMYIIIMLFCNLFINVTVNNSIKMMESKVSMLVFGGLLLLVLFFKNSDGFLDRKYYDLFFSIGFKNSANIPPILISQECIDNSIQLIFDNVGIPFSYWQNHKEELESILNISISSIKIGKNNRQIIINACHGKFDYSKDIYWNDENHPQNKGSLLIGESLFNKIYVSLNDYPHILIGGATGSGKTLLLKLILMQCINNGFIVNIADFKGGVDFGRIWENHCMFVTDISNTTKKLDEIISELENRKKLYAKNGYKNISEYNNHELIKHKRIIFACDELAELLDTTGLSPREKEPIKKIQNQLSSLARLGRAFGIHLILATQRPDANIISGQIKNNISYKICGRADQVLSQIILDNTDASTYIPSDSKGLFLNQDGTLFKAYLFDETTDIQGGGRMHTEQ